MALASTGWFHRAPFQGSGHERHNAARVNGSANKEAEMFWASLVATCASVAGLAVMGPGSNHFAIDLLQIAAVIGAFVTICSGEARLAS
jgi:hypothetical protein